MEVNFASNKGMNRYEYTHMTAALVSDLWIKVLAV